jgi:hemoglobin
VSPAGATTTLVVEGSGARVLRLEAPPLKVVRGEVLLEGPPLDCGRLDLAPPASKDLYARLGGLKAIEAVVDDFLARLTADARITSNAKVTGRLAAIHLPSLRQHVIDQVCQVTGGPCRYTGRDMKSSHAGLEITKAQWDAAVEDLVATLDKFQVGAKEKAELLAILGPLEKDVVEKP